MSQHLRDVWLKAQTSHQQKKVKKLISPLLRSMLSGQRRTGPKFSEDSKFNRYGSDVKNYICHKTGERLNPECVKKSVKVVGGSVMVWGMFFCRRIWESSTATVHGRVNANAYQNLLQQHLPCKHLPISLQFSCKTIPLSHSKSGKRSSLKLKHWNIEMAGQETWSEPNSKSL